MATIESPWYPHQHGVNLKHYAYSIKLQSGDETEKEAYSEAMKVLGSAQSNLTAQESIDQNYSRLNALWKNEREKEEAFIEKYLKVPIDDSNLTDTQKLLKAVNDILNNKSIFDNAVRTIQDLKMDQKGQYKGGQGVVYSYLNHTLPNVIATTCNNFIANFDPSDIDREMNRLREELKVAINDSINAEMNKDHLKDYDDALNVFFSQMDSVTRDEFVNKILEAYNIDLDGLKKTYQNMINNKKNPRSPKEAVSAIGKGKRLGAGNAFETMVDQILSNISKNLSTGDGKDIQVIAQQTGQLGFMKADQIVYFDIPVNISEIEQIFEETTAKITDETSKRLKNMEGMEAMMDSLKEMEGMIVEISDKNYNLTGQALSQTMPYAGGFAAETPNLSSLQKTLGKSKISPDQVEDLIFVLVNSGADVINQRNTYAAERLIALNIASFLFDDINITETLDDYSSSLTKLHMFNLNGVIVPLSVFLEGAAKAFETSVIVEFQKYVKVDFHEAKSIKAPNPAKDKLTQEDWNEYYNAKLKGNTVAIHFFGDFINFVKQNLNFI